MIVILRFSKTLFVHKRNVSPIKTVSFMHIDKHYCQYSNVLRHAYVSLERLRLRDEKIQALSPFPSMWASKKLERNR